MTKSEQFQFRAIIMYNTKQVQKETATALAKIFNDYYYLSIVLAKICNDFYYQSIVLAQILIRGFIREKGA